MLLTYLMQYFSCVSTGTTLFGLGGGRRGLLVVFSFFFSDTIFFSVFLSIPFFLLLLGADCNAGSRLGGNASNQFEHAHKCTGCYKAKDPGGPWPWQQERKDVRKGA